MTSLSLCAKKEVAFKFESPLSASEEEEKATRFSQVSQLLSQAAEYDQAIVMNVDFDAAIRDAITGIGAPAKWLNSIEQVMESRETAKMQEAIMQAAEIAGNAGE